VQEVLSALREAESGDFIIAALNAGQGDCCVMRLPDGKIVVVDCNVRSANVNLLGFLEKAKIKTIDLLVLTHPDQDHVSGLPALVDAVKIRAVVDGRFRKEDGAGDRTPGYEDYRAAIDKLKAGGTQFMPRTAVAGDALDIGGVNIRFLAPHAPMQADDANEASLAFRVSSGNRSALFGGDVTATTWEQIERREGSKLKSDVFWCSHHGAESGCHPPAVRSIAPKLTIVSVGENSYGHPHSDAMSTYREHSGGVRKTEDGTIALVSEKGGQWKEIT
jgi:beta-lactamase superfamily II metal-dependent hydrolase